MEVKKIDILPINFGSAHNEQAVRRPIDKPKIPVNPSIDLLFHRKRQDFQKELEKLSEVLDQFLERINEVLNPLNKELKVEIDQELNIPIFKIINKITNEVIRQIPLEEILRIMKNIERFLEAQQISGEYLKGLLLKAEV